jgi:transcriptional regulator with PAS, ATPase and Fis domain
MSGKKRIKDIIPSNTPIYLREDFELNDVLKLFSENDEIEIIPILNNQFHPVGIIPKNTVFKVLLQENNSKISIKESMVYEFNLINEDASLDDLLTRYSSSCLPLIVVNKDGRFSGTITQNKLLDRYQFQLASIQKRYHALSKSFKEKLKEFKRKSNLFQNVLDSAYEGIIVTDEKGVIRYCNPQRLNCIQHKEKNEVINKHLSLIKPHSGLFDVLETGEPNIGVPFRNNDGQEMVVSRVPIKQNGKIIGAMGVLLFKDLTDLKHLLQRVNLLETTVEHYKNELQSTWSSRYTISNIIGSSKAIEDARHLALKAAKTSSPVLILGESGTGKELFAHAIHYASPRRNKPMIRVDCSAIPKDLLEAELFGYEVGAFTGAGRKAKPGKFELADKGTIFLDEIADMPLEMQAKLLRVLQEKEITRIGGTKPIRIDFRLISATHQDLDKLAKENSFRADLYYRLNVIRLVTPPLRERKEDISLFSNHFLKKICDQNGKGDIRLPRGASELLQGYDWPGNVRELENILERTVNFIEGDTINVDDLSSFLRNSIKTAYNPPRLKKCVTDVEKKLLSEVIESVAGNKAEAARTLGIHRTTLYKKLTRFNTIIN